MSSTLPSEQLPTPRGDALAERIAVTALLLLILALAAALRLVGLDWDEGHLLHPDERFLSWTTADMKSVDSLAEYFDTRTSTLNPNNVGHAFYVYGNFPTILTRYVGEAVGKTALYEVYKVGRALSVAFDLLTVLLVFLAARRLFDRRVGLLAAALYAGAAFPIQQAHFFTVDAMANTFVAASFWFAARALFRHRWPDYVLFGLALGLGMACKITVVPLALVLIAALALRVARERGLLGRRWFDAWSTNHSESVTPRRALVRATTGLILAGMVTVLTFRVGQPYAFLPPHSDEPVSEELGSGLALFSRLADPLGFRPNPDWLAQIQEVRRWVTGQVDAPPNHQWAHRTPLVFPWVNMVRVGLGWPLGLFAWLAFLWALWEIGRAHRGAARLVLPVIWVGMFFLWQGSGWVMTMRYLLPIYPFLLMLAAWAIVTMWDRVQALIAAREASPRHWSALMVAGIGAFVLISGLAWGFAVSRIYTRPHTRVAASHWIAEHIPSDITLLVETEDGLRQMQIGLPNNWPPVDLTTPEDPTTPRLQSAYLEAGVMRRVEFEMPFTGTLSTIRLNHVLAATGQGTPATLRVALFGGSDMGIPLAQGSISGDFAPIDDPRGAAYSIEIAPALLEEGRHYVLTLMPDKEHALILSDSTIAVEGSWDDPVPISLAPYTMWGVQYQALTFEMAWEDTPEKRARIQYVLDHADYLTISSNRFYASLSRNPQRWPLSIAYYRALFSGELGFDLIGDFTSYPNLGPLRFNDDSAEEAWTVYDHPRVFVFRKSPNYDPARVAAVLNSVDLNNVVRAIAGEAKGRPVRIPLPPPRTQPVVIETLPLAAANAADYDPTPTDFYSRAQPLTVILWWALIAVVGWAAFPMLWVSLPALPDRAYPLARTFGLLFVAWLAWLLASLKILLWNSPTILLALLALAALSAGLVWPRRRAFRTWLRANRHRILLTEGILALLYVAFVLIRWGNPDLWHPAFGGEKPMDLAYFNAVLRSTTFPPYDPWFAGGTINYYYFGFVIAGVPVKLLGMRTTLAYNLILPTLFALTGAGAFSVAYNLTAVGDSSNAVSAPKGPSLWETLRRWPQITPDELWAALYRSMASLPWRALAAGMAALLLAVVLGNLDEIRTVLWGLAELGSGTAEWAIKALPPLDDVLRGLSITLTTGTPLPIGIGEWYWNATRLIPVPITPEGIPTEVGPITEFPFFTFLYADLHAHMIAMPITLLALGWCVAQVRGAEAAEASTPSRLRCWMEALLSGFVGALAIGALRPTNTWDWLTYLALGIAALALAHFRRRGSEMALSALGVGVVAALLAGGVVFWIGISNAAQPGGGRLLLPLAGSVALIALLGAYAAALTRIRQHYPDALHDALHHWITLFGVGVQAALLIVATMVLFLPYLQHYRLGYDHIIPWTGSRTPLWAYVDILGLFLFVIITWLLWEARQAWPAFNRRTIVPLLGVLAGIVLVTFWAASALSPIATLAVPLIVLTVWLLLRPHQLIEKRLALMMVAAALALTLAVEIVVLQGDISRMNTVFKFYLQVWILLAVVAGAALGWLIPALRKAPEALRLAWLAVLGLLVFLAALYPLMATRAKVEDRWNPTAPHTLDGMAYMLTIQHYENESVLNLAADYTLLRWLQDHITGHPVIVEGLSWREYLWGSRVSVYTGLPAVVGWNWHQRQQRPWQADEVWQRHADVAELYNTPDPQRAMILLNRYNVSLIIVGELERAYYQPAGLEKFRQMAQAGLLRILYERDGNLIYEVVRG